MITASRNHPWLESRAAKVLGIEYPIVQGLWEDCLRLNLQQR